MFLTLFCQISDILFVSEKSELAWVCWESHTGYKTVCNEWGSGWCSSCASSSHQVSNVHTLLSVLKSIPQCIVMKFLGILSLVALPDCSYRAWLWVSHNALFWESQTHSVNDSIIWFWLSISGNASKKLHCGNVVNMPYLWIDIIGPTGMHSWPCFAHLLNTWQVHRSVLLRQWKHIWSWPSNFG